MDIRGRACDFMEDRCLRTGAADWDASMQMTVGGYWQAVLEGNAARRRAGNLLAIPWNQRIESLRHPHECGDYSCLLAISQGYGVNVAVHTPRGGFTPYCTVQAQQGGPVGAIPTFRLLWYNPGAGGECCHYAPILLRS